MGNSLPKLCWRRKEVGGEGEEELGERREPVKMGRPMKFRPREKAAKKGRQREKVKRDAGEA